jgi:hypothetical protein
MIVRFRFAFSILCVVLLGLLAPSVLRADNIVTNGDFSASGANWIFTPAASGSDFHFDVGDAAFGGVSAGSYDTISQVLTTDPGVDYTLTFSLQNATGTSDADFQALWNGAGVLDVPGTSSFGYTTFTVDVIGTGSDTLGFEGYQVPSWYNLTNVDVEATPEPSSLLLLGSGLAVLGGLVRRKLRA